jgi:hypothetical protein
MKNYLSKARLFVITALGSAALLAAGAFAATTQAQTTGAANPLPYTTSTSTMDSPVIPAPPSDAPAPMVTTIDASGNILIRGVVQSVGTDSLTLAGWGGTYTIRTTADTTVAPVGVNGAGDVSGIMPGDFVGVDGVVAPDQVWTVNAADVRDWTKAPIATTGDMTSADTGASTDTTVSPPPADVTTPTDTSSTSATGLSAGDTLFVGTASNVDASSSSFTLTDASGNTYTVSTTPDATIWDSSSNAQTLGNIQDGDSIRLDGVESGTSITADVVRDTSI